MNCYTLYAFKELNCFINIRNSPAKTIQKCINIIAQLQQTILGFLKQIFFDEFVVK